MDVAEILAELEYDRGRFPREALEDAVANRDAIIPGLLAALERSIAGIEELGDRPEYTLHIYAMFLLAQFREPRAYPLIAQFFSTPGDAVHIATGDVVTEDLPRILASVACGDDSLIKALIENEHADEYVRDAAVRALVTLVVCGEIQREEVVGYFHQLLKSKIRRAPSMVWNSLVSCSVDLYPEELYQDIEQCFREGLVDPFFITLQHVRQRMDLGKKYSLEKLASDAFYTLVTDTIGDIKGWGRFGPSETQLSRETGDHGETVSQPFAPGRVRGSAAAPNRLKKIGRNEPCPCGSGKKYKKCCLPKQREKSSVQEIPFTVDELDELDELSNSVLDLVRSGQVDEAEQVCRQLLARYPDYVDGLDRFAIVCEAKGEREKAAEYYRKAAEFMRTHPGFDSDSIAWALQEAERVEAEHEAGQEPLGPRCRR